MIRRILVLAGTVAAGYGLSLLLPQLRAVLPWLVGGPLIHDLLVAPLVGGAGALVARSRVVAAALAVTGTLLLIAVPLLWRPHPASPNPGLLDRDYLTGLAAFLGLVWALAALAMLWPRLRLARKRQVARNDTGSESRTGGRRRGPTCGERTGSTRPP